MSTVIVGVEKKRGSEIAICDAEETSGVDHSEEKGGGVKNLINVFRVLYGTAIKS